MKKMTRLQLAAVVCGVAAVTAACGGRTVTAGAGDDGPVTVGNPYLPLWEHIPDGEPYVFEDPDNPGHERVYIYGSHDTRITDYCGTDLVAWSAPVEDLNHWRYDGVILAVNRNAAGERLYRNDTQADVLFAPDVALQVAADGTKTYYLYPNDQTWPRQNLVAKSTRPDGPFEVCNWREGNPNATEGPMGFDPAVLVDDDGRVYGYWGFKKSYAGELDPATMATLLPGTEAVQDMVPNLDQEGVFKFYEASSIRKIKDKYVFIFSRMTLDGEFGLPTTNYTLAYAYSDQPLGPWTYGGTIIDARARETGPDGKVFASATINGNTHGSICCVNGQWYVFYHRQTGFDEYARQAMVAPVTVEVEEGPGGKVTISEGEVTSEGFATDGLNPLEWHPAAICCWHTGPTPTIHAAKKIFSGSYIASGYGTDGNMAHPYALRNSINQVKNNTNGSIVGYKYFNLDALKGCSKAKMVLRLIPEGVDGTIRIMADRPWTSQGGVEAGRIDLKATMPQEPVELSAKVPALSKMDGKHAIFLVFESATEGASLCTLEAVGFSR